MDRDGGQPVDPIPVDDHLLGNPRYNHTAHNVSTNATNHFDNSSLVNLTWTNSTTVHLVLTQLAVDSIPPGVNNETPVLDSGFNLSQIINLSVNVSDDDPIITTSFSVNGETDGDNTSEIPEYPTVIIPAIMAFGGYMVIRSRRRKE